MKNLHVIVPNGAKALMLAQREVALFVYDALQLEGTNFTLPEMQTLMAGITVGGHKLGDQQIAVNQAEAWKRLFAWIKNDEFKLYDSFGARTTYKSIQLYHPSRIPLVLLSLQSSVQ